MRHSELVQVSDAPNPKAAQFFSQHATVLTRFATRMQLAVRMYEERQPDWSFYGRHPAGGIIRLQVLHSAGTGINAREGCWIGSVWHLDDLSACVRRLHARRPQRIDGCAATQILAALRDELAVLLRSSSDILDMVTPIYPNEGVATAPPGERIRFDANLQVAKLDPDALDDAQP